MQQTGPRKTPLRSRPHATPAAGAALRLVLSLSSLLTIPVAAGAQEAGTTIVPVPPPQAPAAPPTAMDPTNSALSTKIESDTDRLRALERRFDLLLAAHPELLLAPASDGPAKVDSLDRVDRAGDADRARPRAQERIAAAPWWQDGFTLQTSDSDGAFRLRVGGIVQADGRYFPGNVAPGPVDAFVIRSARVDVDASLGKYVALKILPEFAGGSLALYEAWGELRLFSWLRLRAGKFKAPFGLERLQNESNVIFVERGDPTSSSPNRDIGLMLLGDVAGEALQYALALVNGNGDNNTLDLEVDSSKEVIGRLFVRPFYLTRIEALRGLGIGGAASFGQETGTLAQTLLPSAKSGGQVTFFKYVQGATPALDNTAIADGQRLRATAQGYYYFWRLGVLGEYVWEQNGARLAAVHDTVTQQAWQVYATLLLTDDKASYSGVRPRRPLAFNANASPGAWELAARYSAITFDDKTFSLKFADPTRSARAATSYTVGLNWYLNESARVVLDYIHTDFRGGAPAGDRPSENALIARLQVSL